MYLFQEQYNQKHDSFSVRFDRLLCASLPSYTVSHDVRYVDQYEENPVGGSKPTTIHLEKSTHSVKPDAQRVKPAGSSKHILNLTLHMVSHRQSTIYIIIIYTFNTDIQHESSLVYYWQVSLLLMYLLPYL